MVIINIKCIMYSKVKKFILMVISNCKTVLTGPPIIYPLQRKIYSIIADRTNAFGEPTNLTSEVVNTTGTTFTFLGSIGLSNPFSISLDNPSYLSNKIFIISVIDTSSQIDSQAIVYHFDVGSSRFVFYPDAFSYPNTYYITIEFIEK